MRGLTAEEYDYLLDCSAPLDMDNWISESEILLSNQLTARGLLTEICVGEDATFDRPTRLGMLAMQIYRAISLSSVAA